MSVSFRFLPLVIGLVAALGFHDWTPAPSREPGVSLFARELQSKVGLSFGLVTLRSVVAEQDELVLTLDGTAGWRGGMPSYRMTSDLLRGFCSKPAAASYFAEGRTMRLDTLEAGRHPIRGTPVTRCPQA